MPRSTFGKKVQFRVFLFQPKPADARGCVIGITQQISTSTRASQQPLQTSVPNPVCSHDYCSFIVLTPTDREWAQCGIHQNDKGAVLNNVTLSNYSRPYRVQLKAASTQTHTPLVEDNKPIVNLCNFCASF